MNLNNEEMCNLLNNKNKNEREESEKSNKYIRSKKESEQKENENTKINIVQKLNKKDSKLSKSNKDKLSKIKNTKSIPTKNKVNIHKNINDNKTEKENNINKIQLIEKMPFNGNYIDYKEYEKYILENYNDKLLNTGKEEDIFGQFVDNIIEKSYHIYTNRQCPSCANLLSNGKSCIKCPKYHHLIKSNKIKKKINNN